MSRFDNISAIAPIGGANVLYLTQGRKVYSTDPLLVVPGDLSDVVRVAASSRHGLAVRSNGTVVEFGQAGNRVPAGLSGVVEVAVSATYSLALKSDGTVVQWHYTGSEILPPPPPLVGIQKIAAGSRFALALKSDSTVAHWGALMLLNLDEPGVTKISASHESYAILRANGVTVVTGFGAWTTHARLERTDIIDIFCGDDGTQLQKNRISFLTNSGFLGRMWTVGNTVNVEERRILESPTQVSGVLFASDRSDVAAGYYPLYIDNDGSIRSPYFVRSNGLLPLSVGPFVFPETSAGGNNLAEPFVKGVSSAAVSLDLKLEDLSCAFSGSCSLSALLQGERGFSVAFGCAASASFSLGAARAVFLSPSFNVAAALIVRDPVTFVLSNMRHTYSGAPKQATVTVQSGVFGDVPFRIRYSGNGYSGSTGPTAAGTYSVEVESASEFHYGFTSGVFIIQKATQTILFGPIAPRLVGGPPLALFATSSSGLPVTYSSSNPAVAPISGSSMLSLRAGIATITANQSGNANYFVAEPVSQVVSVLSSRPVIDSVQSVLAFGVGREFSFQFHASGNPKGWILGPMGVLPPGIVFDSSGGVLSGAGLLPGVWRIPVIAYNDAGQSDPVVYSLGIFDVPAREVVKKVLINTLTWAVTFPDPAPAVTDQGGNSTIKTTEIVNGVTVETTTTSAAKVTLAASAGQVRYGDSITFQLSFTESAVSTTTPAPAPPTYTPPVVSARFSLKGYDTDPPFIVTEESLFKKIVVYSGGAYQTIHAVNVDLRSDELLSFLGDFETDGGAQANCICEFELLFRKGYSSGSSGVDRITTQPFLLRVSRDTI
jgi:hypothetical protein